MSHENQTSGSSREQNNEKAREESDERSVPTREVPHDALEQVDVGEIAKGLNRFVVDLGKPG